MCINNHLKNHGTLIKEKIEESKIAKKKARFEHKIKFDELNLKQKVAVIFILSGIALQTGEKY